MRASIVLYLFCLPLMSLAAEFEVFALSEQKVMDKSVVVYVVDQGDLLLNSINKRMKAAGITSEKEGKRFVTPELSDALRHQVTGLIKAARYQLKYLPAIVVDQKYVIYGTTDTTVYEDLK